MRYAKVLSKLTLSDLILIFCSSVCKGKASHEPETIQIESDHDTDAPDSGTEAEAEPEVLISVQTVNSAPENASASSQTPTVIVNDPSSNASANQQICFICNSSSDRPFSDLYGTPSSHSTTPIYDFVWKFLGGKPSVRNDATDASSLNNDVVCAGCLDMLNKYDEAHTNSKLFKREIRRKLDKTEAYFQLVQNQKADTTVERRSDEHPDNEAAFTHSDDSIICMEIVPSVIDLCDDD